MSGPPRLCVVAASELTIIAFLLEHLRAVRREMRVTVVVNTTDPGFARARGLDVDVVPVGIERDIAPALDAAALRRLTSLFRAQRFDIVHSYTPKAGLLTMTAAFLARVPVRVHTFTGQVWATRAGVARRVLKSADRVTARLATHVLVDSHHQREFLIREGVVAPEHSRVLHRGSVAGVDPVRFRPDPVARAEIRAALGIPSDASLFIYLGRLNRDKGIATLADAYSRIAAKRPDVHLLLVGGDEDGLTPEVLRRCAGAADRVHFEGFAERPERYLAAADVLCLPTLREGFGTVLIEAAATGIPVITTDIYGTRDAVVAGVTGLVHAPGDAAGLEAAMQTLVEEPELAATLGREGRKRAIEEFREAGLTRALLEFYRSSLAAGHSPVGAAGPGRGEERVS